MPTSLCISLERDPGSCPKVVLFIELFLPCLCIPSFPDEQMSELIPWNSGKMWRLNEAHFLQTGNGGHRKPPQGPSPLHC